MQQKSEVLYIFTHNKHYKYLLKFKSNKLTFLRTCNTEFDNKTVTFTDQNGRLLKVEFKVNLILVMKKSEWDTL